MSTLQQAAQTNLRGGAPRRRPHLIRNPITILGAIIACVGLGGSGFALVAGFLDEDPSAVKGILGYVVMPSIAFAGVLLMLAGVVRGARREARAAAAAGERPGVRVGLGSRREIFGIAAFGVIAIGSLTVLGGTTYRAIEFTESTTFCGTCHTVMQPQVEAHLTSPHAGVDCTQCHIAYHSSPLGPNVTAYVNSKIGGLRQMVSVMTDSYDRPVRAPADKIPQTNMTCEGCHAADRNYGVVIRQFTSYGSDQNNTRQTRLLAFPVGGGAAGSNVQGIHWHATARLWYQATDDSRTTISWVGVETSGGMEEWTNPNVPVASDPTQRHLMNCVDCHNRVGHTIPGPDELVDSALEHGLIDRNLPFIKRESVSLLGGDGEGANPDLLAARFRQAGWFDQLDTFYKDNYPDVAASRHDAIRNAIDELKKISTQILYPDMSTDWLTYPDNLSHRLPEGIQTAAGQDNPGCFRCHGTLVNAKTGERLAGTTGGDGCLACHGVGQDAGVTISGADPTSSQPCTLCHVNVDQTQLSGALTAAGAAESPAPPADSLQLSH